MVYVFNCLRRINNSKWTVCIVTCFKNSLTHQLHLDTSDFCCVERSMWRSLFVRCVFICWHHTSMLKDKLGRSQYQHQYQSEAIAAPILGVWILSLAPYARQDPWLPTAIPTRTSGAHSHPMATAIESHGLALAYSARERIPTPILACLPQTLSLLKGIYIVLGINTYITFFFLSFISQRSLLTKKFKLLSEGCHKKILL